MRSLSGLALAHFLANGLLLWLGYYWLGIGEARSSALLWSAAVALALIALTSCVYGAAFSYFPADTQGAVSAWRTALRHLLPLSILAMVVLMLYGVLAFCAASTASPAATVASYLTLTFRKPVPPSTIQSVLDGAFWLLRWMILPALLLPVIADVARHGWSGLRGFGPATRRWIYWIQAPALLLCAVWLPLKLLGWIPQVHGFGMEATSFVLRASLAYLLFVAAGLLVAWASSAGNPRLTQPSTAVSP